jgi:hypothetical protein
VSGSFEPRGSSRIELQLLAQGSVRIRVDGDQFTIELPEAVASDLAESLIAVAGQLSAARAAHLHAEAKPS